MTLETGFLSWVLVALFAFFMPLTALSFRQFRFQKKQKQFEEVLARLDINDSRALVAQESLNQEFSGHDYLVPVGFITGLSILGSIFFIFGGSLDLLHIVNIPLEGGYFPNIGAVDEGEVNASALYQHKAMAIVGWAFAGAFVWSMQNILRRLVMVDLQPAAYYSMSVRIILAVLIALIIFHGADGMLDNGAIALIAGQGNTDTLLPALAFVIGTVPNRWLQFVKTKVSQLGDKVERRTRATGDEMLPLDSIQGMNSFHRSRLSEIGVDNSQNLATTGLITLMTKTPFDPSQLLDWIGQAMLHVRFGDRMQQLQSAGIRTVYDLWRLDEYPYRSIEEDLNGEVRSRDPRPPIMLLEQASKIEIEILLLATISIRGEERVRVLAGYENALANS